MSRTNFHSLFEAIRSLNDRTTNISALIKIQLFSQTNVNNIYFQNFEPVAVPTRDHGKFFTGDSYIILNVCKRSRFFYLFLLAHFDVISFDSHFLHRL